MLDQNVNATVNPDLKEDGIELSADVKKSTTDAGTKSN